MAYHSTVDDIEEEISSWGYSTPLSDYGRQSDIAGRLPPTTKVGGRGRGITNPQNMASIRLATEISDLKAHSFPMGHMPTTQELLGAPAENEITPLLRQLGLSSQDDDLDSRTTRRIVSGNEEIRLDGNVPLIMSGDLFKRSSAVKEDDEGVEEVEEYDPNQPLHEQFSTIPELYIPEEEEEEIVIPPAKPTKSAKSVKANTTDSSIDSGITVGSNSSGQSKKKTKEGKAGKKKKWRKMTPEELVPQEPERDRYEEVYAVGVHDSSNTGAYVPRQLYGANGLKGWSNAL